MNDQKTATETNSPGDVLTLSNEETVRLFTDCLQHPTEGWITLKSMSRAPTIELNKVIIIAKDLTREVNQTHAAFVITPEHVGWIGLPVMWDNKTGAK